MDKQAVEARVEQIFRDAKPNPKSRYKRYFKLAAVICLTVLPLSIGQELNNQPLPAEPPATEFAALGQDPQQPSFAIDTTRPSTVITAQPGDFFFCGCTRTRSTVNLLPQGFCNDPVAKQETADTI